MKIYTKGNQRVRIEPDDMPISPREDDNLGTIVTWHSRYTIGDEQPREDPETWRESVTEWEEGDAETPGDKFNRLFVWLPVYMYDHGDITINTSGFSCPWDSGQVGLIYVSRERLERERMSAEQALEYLNGEIEVYDKYLRGEVYFCVLEEYNEEADTWERTDACGGFYGDDYLKNGMADYFPLLKESECMESEATE